MSKDDTLILHGGGPRDSIDERCALLKESIAATASDYEKEKLQVYPLFFSITSESILPLFPSLIQAAW